MTSPVVHFEMPAEDRQRMRTFYETVFGWKTEQLGSDMADYVMVTTTDTDSNGMVTVPGTINGGFYQKTEDPAMQHPSVVISVQDLEGSIERVRSAGGSVHGEAMDIPGVGRFVSIVDTEGNRISMLQPAPRG